jgi:hypothetical protein
MSNYTSIGYVGRPVYSNVLGEDGGQEASRRREEKGGRMQEGEGRKQKA